MKAVRKMLNNICYLDLDGVFVPYPKCWLDYIELKTGKHFDSLDEAKKKLAHAEYVRLKEDYRSSEFKYNLLPRKGSSKFTRFLQDEGYQIIIATTRPIDHSKLLIRTIRWLDRNNIFFDDIIFQKEFEVVTKYPDFIFGVEDEPYIANILAKWGYRMFLMRNSRNIYNLHEKVIVVDCFEDIMNNIKYKKYKETNFPELYLEIKDKNISSLTT